MSENALTAGGKKVKPKGGQQRCGTVSNGPATIRISFESSAKVVVAIRVALGGLVEELPQGMRVICGCELQQGTVSKGSSEGTARSSCVSTSILKFAVVSYA